MEIYIMAAIVLALASAFYLLNSKIKANERETYYFIDGYSEANKDEREFYELLLKHKASMNQKILLDFTASNIAQIHSSYMVDKEKASHDNFPDRLKMMIDLGATNAGEIVGNHTDIERMFKEFLESDDHRLKIENTTYKACGISILRTEKRMAFCTVIFFDYKK